MYNKLKNLFYPDSTIAYEEELINFIKAGDEAGLAELIDIRSINPTLLTKVKNI